MRGLGFVLSALTFLGSVSGAALAQDAGVSDGILPGGNLLACETYSLRDLFKSGQLDIMSYPAKMKELGIKGIAINRWYLKSLDDPYLDEVKAAAKAQDRVIVALITGANLCTPDDKARAAGIESLQKDMRAAQYLGAGIIRSDLGKPGPDEPMDKGVERVIAAFKELLPLAKELNVKITMENHGGITTSADTILRIIQETDPQWVGSCLDFKNWPKDKILEENKKLAPYAFHTHAKAHQFKEDGEEAVADYKAILGFLKEAGYKGPISIEWEGGGDPIEGVKKTRDLIIKYWK